MAGSERYLWIRRTGGVRASCMGAHLELHANLDPSIQVVLLSSGVHSKDRVRAIMTPRGEPLPGGDQHIHAPPGPADAARLCSRRP